MSIRPVTIGVLGGMGPEASAEFHRELIRRNPVSTDQEHFRILVLDDPRIPDRTRFILEKGEDPRPALCERARELESFGASFIAIPCNTAHVFWDQIQASVSIPVLNIVEATVDSIPDDAGSIGLLSTRGTIAGGLYEKVLRRSNRIPLLPDEALQERVDAIIAGVKQGQSRHRLAGGLRLCGTRLREAGADAAILGCTELGMLTEGWDPPLPLYDSVAALAEATLAKARELEAAASAGHQASPVA